MYDALMLSYSFNHNQNKTKVNNIGFFTYYNKKEFFIFFKGNLIIYMTFNLFATSSFCNFLYVYSSTYTNELLQFSPS